MSTGKYFLVHRYSLNPPFWRDCDTQKVFSRLGYQLVIRERKRQTVYKPGSVHLTIETARIDGHSSGTPVTERLAQPTQTATRKPASRPSPVCRPYLVLLPVGFALPPSLLTARCALTTPFHPYLANREDAPGGFLSVALSLGSPPPGVTRHRVSVEPGLSSPRRAHARRRAAIRPSGACST